MNNIYVGDGIEERVHNTSFPANFRMLIVGQSGCGKTCLLMKLLLEPNLLNYKKLYVFARSLYQPQYKILKSGIENKLPKEDIIRLLNSTNLCKEYNRTVDEVAIGLSNDNEENEIPPSDIEGEFNTNAGDIPDPSDLDMSIRNLIVFDDILTDSNQTTAENYYTRGRSANCDAIYLSQNYTRLPLHTIRSNANFMIFFKSSPLTVDQLFRNFASVDMNLNDFKEFCKKAWGIKHGYIIIDLSHEYGDGKYRSNLFL